MDIFNYVYSFTMLMFHLLYRLKSFDAYLISMKLLFDRYSLLLWMMTIRPYLYHLFLMDMLLSMHCQSLLRTQNLFSF